MCVAKIFTASLSNPDTNVYVTLELPADPYAVMDAWERLRPAPDTRVVWDIEDYGEFPILFHSTQPGKDFPAANALAERLAGLDDRQRTAFNGLVKLAGKRMEIYNLWNQMREEVCRTYSEQLPERLPLSQQKEFKPVRNMVIREVLKLGQSEYPTADEVVHMPTPPSTPSMQSGAPSVAYGPQREATFHRHTRTQRAVSHADAARCVLQLFRNMGHIFQEQSAADTIQAGLHIDKKRRRMLREKRMALGHKADDHEDAVSINTPK